MLNSKSKKIVTIILIVLLSVSVAAVAVSEIVIAVNRADRVAVLADAPRYIAHRGYSSAYFQNTEEAYIGAGQSDFFYGIETDIWRTSDGVWVCCHDNDPFADKSIKISDITYAEAMQIELDPTMSGEDLDDMHGKYICTFERYLEICRVYNKTAVIELKAHETQATLTEMLNLAQSKLPNEQITIISFKKGNIDGLYDIDKTLNLQLLGIFSLPAYYNARMGYNIGVSATFASKALADLSAASGNTLNVWGVKTKEQADSLYAYGVDYITTDYILV